MARLGKLLSGILIVQAVVFATPVSVAAATIDERLARTAVSPEVVAQRTMVIKDYIKGQNTADADLVAGLFAEDAVVIDPLGGTPIVGRDAIKSFYINGPFLKPIKSELDGQVRVAGNSAAFAFNAVSDGKLMHIIDVMEFNEAGKITKMTAYWSNANVSPAPQE